MPRGDKAKYTDKQIRKAEHIEEAYVEKGRSPDEAERIAWATVNKDDGGGKKPGGSGRGKDTGHPAATAVESWAELPQRHVQLPNAVLRHERLPRRAGRTRRRGNDPSCFTLLLHRRPRNRLSPF